MDPPPPSYPESISTYDPRWDYSPGSETGSIQSLSSPTPSSYPRDHRRFSDASNVLPRDTYHSQGSSGSSHRSAPRTPDYLQYVNAAGLPTPPLSTSQPPRSIPETLRLDTASSLAQSAYFPRSETDDPAMLRMFPPAPTQYPPDSRRGNSIPQWSPTQLPSPQSIQPELPPLPYICAFQDKQYGQMILAPPESWTDQTPLFFIDVHPNCFIPTSYVTSIYRGRASRELVARFEMGISLGEPTLFMGQKLCPLKDVFSKFRKVNTKLRDRWAWTREGYKLHWDCRSEVESVCWHEHDPEHTPIARIKPASAQPPGSMSTRPPTTRLEIYTQSPALMDEIVVSALIVERRRLSPTDGNKNEDLFN